MSAIAIILLILFLISVGMALYYAMLCFQIPSDSKRPKSGDLGPLLSTDNDLNGNVEPEVVVHPIRSIDEPDKSNLDDDSFEESSKDCELFKGVSYQTTPQCASKDPKAEAVFLPIEDEPSTNTSKPVMAPVRRDLKPAFLASSVRPKTAPHPDTLSNSYEEDGLLVPRNQVANAALLVDEHNCISEEPKQQQQAPKKHVQFNTTPEEGTPIDETPTTDDNEPVFRLNSTVPQPITATENPQTASPENPSRAPYPIESPFPTVIVSAPQESGEDVVVVHPEETTAGPIGWVVPPKEQSDEEDVNKDESEVKMTSDKVFFLPNHRSESPAEDTGSDTSDPEVTEYSFLTGPQVPSTAAVLANEMGSYSDPSVTSYVSLPDAGQHPPTPSESDDDDDEPNIMGQNVLGTPPQTPPEDKMSLVIGNPRAEEESPRSQNSNPEEATRRNHQRSESTSSSLSTSSSSSSSTNGSYRIHNGDKIENSSSHKTANEKSQIPKVVK